MKNRLRKKKHIGEFAVFGKNLAVVRNTAEGPDEFLDAFIQDAIEANGCFIGGGIDGAFVELGRACDLPEEKFARIVAWLDARPDVERWEAGPLLDANYGPFEDS